MTHRIGDREAEVKHDGWDGRWVSCGLFLLDGRGCLLPDKGFT